MVVQGAVTPGRTRRLMLKLPVGTLRRNSGERVRSPHFLPSSDTLPLPPSLSLSLSLCLPVLWCVCVCVCVYVGFKKVLG